MLLNHPISVPLGEGRKHGRTTVVRWPAAKPRPVRPATVLWETAQRGLALLALIALLPLLLTVALAVMLEDGGPVFFTHRRIGRDGAPFGCLKFRTMCVDAQERLAALLSSSPSAREEWAREQKLRHDPRVTRIGRLLRTTSLDEAPQLLNVLRGDMNLVGPRPIVESEIPRYGTHFQTYRAIKPGITGLWQVSGRSEVGYRKRVALDVLYVRRRSARLDLWILTRTIPTVLRRQGSW